MDAPDAASLARAALDTLPINVAVVDDEGAIVQTNRAWRAFGESNGLAGDADMYGVNYLDVTEAAAPEDADARRALDGIREVLNGERETFTMEYPCHSPDERRWFLMRVSRFALDDVPFVVVGHLDVTDRKLAELAASRRAEALERERQALAEVLDRVEGVVRNVTQVLVTAESREEVERGVCESIVAADPYAFAWLGRPELASEVIVPRAWAGITGIDIEAFEAGEDERTHPARRAVRERDLHVVQRIDDAPAGRWREVARDHGFRAVAAAPLVYRDTVYGVLVAYADRPKVFNDRERRILETVGRTAAHAINALESKRLLATDTVVEVEFAVRDDLPLVRLARETGGRFEYHGGVVGDDGRFDVLFGATGVSPDRIRSMVADVDEVVDVTVVAEREDEALVEFGIVDPVVAGFSDYGVAVRSIAVDDTEVRIGLDLPSRDTARTVVDLLDDRFDDVELTAYRERDRRLETAIESRASVEDRLTDRQLTALRSAYYGGFFDWPRTVTGDELAASMDISRSTFHQHLRAAERKLLEEFFEPRDADA